MPNIFFVCVCVRVHVCVCVRVVVLGLHCDTQASVVAANMLSCSIWDLSSLTVGLH